ncbi:winged helix-turn-helix domain-containing protein [Brevundimonas sp.]|uniref:winged helix-turn-helix domain-containing protein n=1 Tax=Brevundimonas sp. TaxID=1871086 RepID=UPI002D751A25|nr:winged helix-turn-helix domain-containing protein [Brevundimonas sp.]HYC99121.1 winged helix-turn-helix domain-containing protein [Brevundimonas sp.]
MLLLFGDCVLDPDRRELNRASGAIAVGPQVFDLLLYLIENRGRVVSKDDLLEAVWRGRIVSESTITSHINAARTVNRRQRSGTEIHPHGGPQGFPVRG